MADPRKEKLLTEGLREALGHEILGTTVHRGQVCHLVERTAIAHVCTFLKTDPRFAMNYCSDVIGVDWPGRDPRFDVVYVLYSVPNRLRVRLKVQVGEGETVPSVTSVWRGADWPEREVYDMFGIVFDGHPDLKRIYLAHDWKGHPLRKDYPLRGYKDRYNPFGEEADQE